MIMVYERKMYGVVNHQVPLNFLMNQRVLNQFYLKFTFTLMCVAG
jgi:hypothetical protein